MGSSGWICMKSHSNLLFQHLLLESTRSHTQVKQRQFRPALLYLSCRSHGCSFRKRYPEKKGIRAAEQLITQCMLGAFWSPQIRLGRPLTTSEHVLFLCLVRSNHVSVFALKVTSSVHPSIPPPGA